MIALLQGVGAALLGLAASALGLGTLAAGALSVALFTADGNDFKPYVVSGLSSGVGRQVVIRGDLQVEWGWQPRIVAHQVKVADAPWANRPWMVGIERLVIRFDARNLLRGEIVLPEIVLHAPAVTLSTAADGRHNWAFLTQGPEADPGGVGMGPPVIESVHVSGGVLTYIDHRSAVRMQALVDSARGALLGPRGGARLEASGSIDGVPLAITLRGNPFRAGDGAQASRPIHLEVDLARTRVVVEGTVTTVDDGSPLFDLDLRLASPGFDSLRALLPWELPEWPEFRLEAHAIGEADRLVIEKLDASVGESDLQGRIVLTHAEEPPRFHARLQSRKLDLVQIFGEPSDRPGPIISEQALDFGPLRAFNADVQFDGRTVYLPEVTVQHVELGASLHDGLLRFRRLSLQAGGGRIHAPELTVNARKRPPELVADLRIENVNLRAALAEFDIEAEAFGTLNGGLQLAASGRSPADILGSADGDVQVVMQRGRLDQLLITLAGEQVPEILAALTGEEGGTVPLRCMIANFEVADGVMNSSMLLVDTPDVQIIGGGEVSLEAQTVDLAIAPRHKDFSPLAAEAPVHIEGPFRDISIAVDTSAAVASLITPFELPDAEDADCRELARKVRTD